MFMSRTPCGSRRTFQRPCRGQRESGEETSGAVLQYPHPQGRLPCFGDSVPHASSAKVRGQGFSTWQALEVQQKQACLVAGLVLCSCAPFAVRTPRAAPLFLFANCCVGIDDGVPSIAGYAPYDVAHMANSDTVPQHVCLDRRKRAAANVHCIAQSQGARRYKRIGASLHQRHPGCRRQLQQSELH